MFGVIMSILGICVAVTALFLLFVYWGGVMCIVIEKLDVERMQEERAEKIYQKLRKDKE